MAECERKGNITGERKGRTQCSKQSYDKDFQVGDAEGVQGVCGRQRKRPREESKGATTSFPHEMGRDVNS